MKTIEFTTVNVYNYNINDSHAIITSTIAYAEPVKEQFDVLTLASFNDMKTTDAAMAARMNIAAKDPATQAIDDEDLTRDGWWREVRSDVKTACNSLDAARREAGLALKAFFTPYWNLDKAPLPTETNIIKEIMDKIQESATFTAHVATLGLATKLESMYASNTRFNTLYTNRNSGQAVKSGSAASTLKSAAAVSYSQFSYLVEMANVLTPSDTLKTLFNNMEQVRKKYAAIYNITANDKGDGTTDTATTANPA